MKEHPVTENEAARIARTEALFREVNERIAEAAERFGADDSSFVCECADATCTHRVSASLDEYERVRDDGSRFLLVPGHEDERVEAVVGEEDGHAIVEKQHEWVRQLALELDPRTA
jgi:ferredoxin